MGGNVFPNSKKIKPEDIDFLVQTVEEILNVKATVVGSCYNKHSRNEFGDLDLMVELSEVEQLTNTTTPLGAKRSLVKHFESLDFPAAYTGSIVHVLVNEHQIDIMLVKNVERVSKFHQHLPSNYKGRQAHVLFSHIAKSNGYRWSPFIGLFTRVEGASGDFISDDLGVICRTLDLSGFDNVEQLISEVNPKTVESAKLDPNW